MDSQAANLTNRPKLAGALHILRATKYCNPSKILDLEYERILRKMWVDYLGDHRQTDKNAKTKHYLI